MDEKVIEKIKKLQALAERGVGGEKETAKEKLQKMLEKHGIHSLEELEQEETEFTLFSYKGEHEKTLLHQCIYKVMTASNKTDYYKRRGTRQKVGIYCTPAQKIEIELEFEFYRNLFNEQLELFMQAFIQAQRIFPPDAPHGKYDELSERDMKVSFMASGIDRRTRAEMIEEKM